MVREKWNILANTFEVKTRGSIRKIFSFAEHHYGALHGSTADPFILSIYNSFKPVYDDFNDEYTKWKNMTGSKKAAKYDFNLTLLTMRTKLSFWEGKIFAQFPEGTPEATAIFPNKRTPFYKGNHVVRTEAVLTLSEQLGKYPSLAAVKADVDAFHTLLNGKLGRSLGIVGSLGLQYERLEEKRKTLATEMYGNLGLLMHHFKNNPKEIKRFFDMGVLKNKVHRKKKKDRK